LEKSLVRGRGEDGKEEDRRVGWPRDARQTRRSRAQELDCPWFRQEAGAGQRDQSFPELCRIFQKVFVIVSDAAGTEAARALVGVGGTYGMLALDCLRDGCRLAGWRRKRASQ
jgi:hypothetical protein